MFGGVEGEVMPGGHASLQVQRQGVDSGGRGLPELPLWAVGSVNSLCVTHILRCEERAPRHRSGAGGGLRGVYVSRQAAETQAPVQLFRVLVPSAPGTWAVHTPMGTGRLLEEGLLPSRQARGPLFIRTQVC